MAEEYLCEKCGRHAAPVGGEVPRFCSHCGGTLRAVATPAPKDDDIIPFADDANAIPAPPPPVQFPPPIPVSSPPIEVKIPPVVVPPMVHADSPPPMAPPQVPNSTKGVTEVTPLPVIQTAQKRPPIGDEESDEPLDFREELIRCPNCGKQNPAKTEVCTNCGYARSLGRTLTTRVRSTKPEPAAPPEKKASPRGIAAEKEFETRKRRGGMNPLSDSFRLWVALLLCAGFAVLILIGPKFPYQPPEIEMHGRAIQLPEIRMADALGHLAVLFLLGGALLTFAVRLTFIMMKADNPARMTFLRVAGALALLELAGIGFFYLHLARLHLDAGTLAIAFWSALGVITFLGTWYLQNVRFLPALIISILTAMTSGLAMIFFCTLQPGLMKWLNM